MREAIKLLLLGGDDVAVAPLTTTTTTVSETVTLANIGVNAATEINWGDGNTDTLTDAGARSHTYATAGTYNITFSDVANLTRFDILDSKIAVNTAALRGAVNIGRFVLFNVSGNIDTSDMVDWRPTNWQCVNMSSTATINIDTSDMIDWRPNTWLCLSMPGTATINIDTSDMIDWRLIAWQCRFMPSTATINIAINSQRNWITASQILATDIHLSTAQCDAVIEEFWQQALAGTRTAIGGTIDISGNSAITGAVEPPPGGTPTTTGQKVYELVNDSGARGFNTWTTVTVDTA